MSLGPGLGERLCLVGPLVYVNARPERGLTAYPSALPLIPAHRHVSATGQRHVRTAAAHVVCGT